MNDADKIQIAGAINTHRMMHALMIEVPDDCTDEDAKRFMAEAQQAHPLNAVMQTRYVHPDKVNGGLLHPNGRELDEGETWKVID